MHQLDGVKRLEKKANSRNPSQIAPHEVRAHIAGKSSRRKLITRKYGGRFLSPSTELKRNLERIAQLQFDLATAVSCQAVVRE